MIDLAGRYKKLGDLSGGGMSDTILCFDSNLERQVVVKSLKAGIEPKRLIDELTALSRIRSKHVAQIFDVIRAKDGSIVGFVEEFIDGKPLEPFAKGSSEQDFLHTLYAIVVAVAEIHESGHLHRDMKPENMKRDSSGLIKVFDFGLAKPSSGAKTRDLYFTQYYSAPEIFNKDVDGNHLFTPAVDIYAVGVIALWLLNGGFLPAEIGHIPPDCAAAAALFDGCSVPCPKDITPSLKACVDHNPSKRPSARALANLVGRLLLRDQHRMLIAYDNNVDFIDRSNRSVSLTLGSDHLKVEYNGLSFVVTAVAGHVRHNNVQVVVGYELLGSSVIVFGDPFGDRRLRTSITADISHPEVWH
jgi:serine/threonine protein kinase